MVVLHARRLAREHALGLALIATPQLLLVLTLALHQRWGEREAALADILILAVSLATLAMALAFLQSRLVRPALALVGYVQAQSAGQDQPPPAVPAAWRPSLDALAALFAAGREHEARLLESDLRLKAAAESIPDGLAIFDAQDCLVFFNSRYPAHLTENVRATMALGKAWADWGREALALGPIYHPDMGPDYLAARIADRDGPTADREHRLIDGRWVRVRESRMPDGGRVLLTSDITEARRREEEKTVLALALAQAGDSIEIADSNYRLLFVNPAFTRLTGYAPEEAIGRTPAQILRSDAHDHRFFAEIEAAVEGGRVWTGRITSRHKDGHLIHQEATISPVYDAAGRLTHHVAVKRDLTERIRAEQALEESRAAREVVLNAALDCFVSIDADGIVTAFNPAAERTFGYAREEVIGQPIADVLVPARMRDRHQCGLARHLATGASAILGRRIEVTARRKDGQEIPVEIVVAKLRGAERPAFVAYMRDLSEQKRAEAALKASQARFNDAAESMPDGLVIFDAEDRIVYFNSRYPEHLTPSLRSVLRLGIRFQDWIEAGLAMGPIYHPDMGTDFARHRVAIHRLDRSEHEHKLIDGRWVRIRESRMSDGGRVLLTTDVTEHRRRQQQLALLAKAVEQVGDPVEITDSSRHFTYVNPAFTRLTGYGLEEVRGRLPQGVLGSGLHPPSFFAEMEATLDRGETWQGLIINRRRDGELIYQDTTISPLRDAFGQITHFVAVKRDVTEQEKAEAALRESEARYRAVVETQTEFILRQRPDGSLSFVNEAYCRHMGMSREALLAPEWNDFASILPEDARLYAEHLARLTPEAPTRSIEIRVRLQDGRLSWEQWIDTGVFDREGRLIEIQSVGRDVTERRAAELALQESEARYRTLVETQTEFITRGTPDGRLTFVNEAYCRHHGMTREELLSPTWNDFDPILPEEREEHRAFVNGLTPEQPTGTTELRVRLPDGRLRWERWTIVGIFEGGRLVSVQSVGRDITERKEAELALKASEASFRTIAEGVPLPIAITALDEPHVLFVNPIAAEVFGITAGVTDPNRIARIWADPAQRQEIAERILAHGSLDQAEVRMRTADGTAFDALLSARPIHYAGRRAVLGVVTDITERRRMEEELRASEARLAAFMENAPVGMYVKDLAGRYILLNPEMGKVFGRPAEKLIGKDPAEVFGPAEVEMIKGHDQVILETGRSSVHEEYLPGLDAYSWSMVIRFPIRNDAGEIVQIGGFDVDITRPKLAEAEVRASAQRFKAITDANPLPLVIVRLGDGALRFANRPYLELFGIPEGGLDGLDPSLLYAEPGDRRRYMEAAREAGGEDGVELTLRRLDGATFPAALTSRVVQYEDEPSLVTSIVDLSERKAAEREIQRQREALHQGEKMTALGSLLAGVAHELNNPLSVVVGYSSMLRELAKDEATRTRADRVHAAAERCARIVKTFLAMARAKPPQRGHVAVNDVVEAALELAGYGLRTADVKVERDLDAELPMAWGDADQLHQVFTNLIINAQQALLLVAPPRRLLIRSRRHEGGLAVEIVDNGPGMSEEVRKRVFEPFFTTKPQGVGTGVGLSVCHGIVAAHEGRMTVESREGAGTRFTVWLPLSARASEVAEAEAAEPVARVTGRVLVVDDEPEIADLVAEHLRRDGLEVEIVKSGRAALTRLERGGVDLVVSDLRMPDMDGATLLDRLKLRRPDLARRLILITGDALGAGLNETVREANLPILEKPLDLVALRAQVRRLLEVA